MKWRDKRNANMLSTIHDVLISKTIVIQEYIEAQLFVETSDQMASYYLCICETNKWYIRLFYHLYTQTALANASKFFNNHV